MIITGDDNNCALLSATGNGNCTLPSASNNSYAFSSAASRDVNGLIQTVKIAVWS